MFLIEVITCLLNFGGVVLMRNGNILKALAAGFGALILTIMLAGCGGGSNSAATKHTVRNCSYPPRLR